MAYLMTEGHLREVQTNIKGMHGRTVDSPPLTQSPGPSTQQDGILLFDVLLLCYPKIVRGSQRRDADQNEAE